MLDGIVADLAERGWSVGEGFLADAEVGALTEEAGELWRADRFRPAHVGRGEDRVERPDVRSDRIFWIDPAKPRPAFQPFLSAVEGLRAHLNRELFAGLRDAEIQIAAYPPGSFYRRHVDQFQGSSRRSITFILYLNPDWDPADGGALRLHPGPDEAFVDVWPVANRYVCFKSDAIEHEVLACRRLRFSLTAWFRRQASTLG